MKKISKSFSILISSEILLSVLISIMITLKKTSFVSLFFAVSFIIPFVLMAHKSKKMVYLPFVLIVLCSFNVFINLLMSNGSISFDYLKKLIMFIVFIFLIHYANMYGMNINNQALLIVKAVPLIGAIELLISYFLMNNKEMVAHAITLGFVNPNFAGMWLLHYALYAILWIFEIREHKWVVILLPVVVGLIYLIFLTKARSCFFALLVFAIIVIVWKVKRTLPNWICILIAIIPFVNVYLYMKLYKMSWFQNTFSFLISEGKSLTSRTGVWEKAIYSFHSHPIIGDYYGISYGTGQSQLHNTHMDVLCSYGLVSSIFFVLFLIHIMKHLLENVNSLKQCVAFAAFCSVLVMGCFEAAMVSGATGMNLLTIGLVVLTLANSNEKVELLNEK